jgi:hypothetical protein
MEEPLRRTGTVRSGDVTLFFRAFGPERSGSSKTPIVILHGRLLHLHQMIWPSSTSTMYRACVGIVLQLTPSPTACTMI